MPVKARTILSGLVINPATGLVNVTPAESKEASRLTREREIFNMQFLRADMARAGSAADEAMVERMVALAKGNPKEAMRMIRQFPEVRVLFDRRALYFHP